MDALTIIVMLILFILAMVFVFSTALLTPYIGKKNLISVVLLGLIVGLVGGAFLVSPVIDDLPDFTRGIIEDTVEGSDIVTVELSTNQNLSNIIENLSSINGVQSIDYDGIQIKTDEFSTPADQNKFFTILKNSTNSTGIEDQGSNTYLIKMTKDNDPESVLNATYATFNSNTYIHLKYTSMKAKLTVDAKNISRVMAAIPTDKAIILEITGPTEDITNSINAYLPNQTNVIGICGILGVIISLLGFFIDTVFNSISIFKKKTAKNPTKSEKIRRKAVPNTKSNKRKRNITENLSKRESIDIFSDETDDKSGSRPKHKRPFKVVEKESETKKSSEQKTTKRSFNPFKGSNKKKQSKNQPKRIVPKPKRKN